MEAGSIQNLASSPLRISIVVGGRWHSFDLARELYLKGYLHKIITNYPAFYVQKWGIPREHIVSLPITFFLIKLIYWIGGEDLMMKCQWFIHSWFARQAANHLMGSDVIHAWSSWAEPSLIWAANNSVPSLLERSSAHILEQSRLLDEEYKRLNLGWVATHKEIEKMECREYQLANKISVPSKFVEKSFFDRGFCQSKIVRNGFGVNQALFRPGSADDQSTDSKNLSILYAGVLSVQKGIQDLLVAFQNFPEQKAQLTLLGGITAPIQNLINNNDIRISLAGHRPQAELPDFYKSHDLFVMPSIQDGMAMVQLQALSSGLPLICTTNSGGEDLLQMNGSFPIKQYVAGEVVSEYPSGWVIPIHSPNVMTELFTLVSQNPKILADKKSNAINQTQCDFNWDGYATRAVDIYRRLLVDKNV